MTPESWRRVDQWWSDLFGVPISMLWRDELRVGMHAGLGGYAGIFVAQRHGCVHVSLPDWVTPAHVHEIETTDPAALLLGEHWQRWTPTREMLVLGPSVHAFTDRVPDVGPGALDDVVLLAVADLDGLRAEVTEAEWEEAGFSHAHGRVHAVIESDEVVAAAHLSCFLNGSGDLGVLVRRRSRGRGLGALVGGAATRTAVRTQALGRWRAREDNAPSRALSRALGFEDYCRQLAVRPADA